MLIAEMIARCARTYADKPAYIDGHRVHTWREIHSRSDLLAGALRRRGVGAGDVSVILSQDRLEVLEHWFACVKLGAVRVGANFRYSPREVAHVIADSRATSVVVEGSCRHLLDDAVDGLLASDALLIGFGGEHDLALELEDLVAEGEPLQVPHAARDGDAVAIAYTAGTTGLPKGVIWTHGGLREGMRWLISNVGFRPEDSFLSALPAAAGPLLFVSMNVVNGMTTILPGGRFAARRFLEIIEDRAVTSTMLVPTMLQDVLAELRSTSHNTSSLRLLTYGSMASTPAVIREARTTFGCEVQQWYGSTEMAGIVSILRDSDHAAALEGSPGLLNSCGRPMLHVDIEIRREDGGVAEPDEVGELWVRSETLFAGYHRLPETTAEALVDGWFRPGDIGRIDRDGYVYIMDRKNFMIISGGYNVYPTVVESVLAEHHDVREVAVVGAPHPRWGEAVVAVVSLHHGATVESDELVEIGRARLAKWEAPKHVEIVSELPRGATGKVDRRRIRDGFREHPERLAWSART